MSEVLSNLVPKKKMREVQTDTLTTIRHALENCFGPYASNSIITDPQKKLTQYTKDGHTILKAFKFQHVIEQTVAADLKDITQYIVKTVGDGTTSAVILSEILFKELQKMEDAYAMPYEIISQFKEAVNDIKKEIKKYKKDFTPEGAYDIALISTNGNREIAEQIKEFYEKFGNDLFIQLSTSTDENSYVKEYNGMTLNNGFTEGCFANTLKGTSCIRNPKIYIFEDPIDTIEMVGLFTSIMENNLFRPIENIQKGIKKDNEVIPTVILTPKISRDAQSVMENLAKFLYSIQDVQQRPPILIISNIMEHEQIADISTLCGCKPIKKYLDPKLQESDIKKGIAPSPKNISSFGGEADMVESDISSTSIINPKEMYVEDKNGNQVPSKEYTSLLTFLESRLKNAQESQEDLNVIGNLRKRIHSLQSNMIEYFVGGVSASDRDSLKDLVEDAIKNCRSAAQSGIGYGANFEGLRASYNICHNTNSESTINPFYKIIYEAYSELLTFLYNTGLNDEVRAKELVKKSLNNSKPFNLRTKKFDGKVLSSIDSDIVILDGISKILTLMYTSNQLFCQDPIHNIYEIAK